MATSAFIPAHQSNGIRCRCPLCGAHQQANALQTPQACSACHGRYRVLDRQGRTAPVISDNQLAAIRSDPSATRTISQATRAWQGRSPAAQAPSPAPTSAQHKTIDCPHCGRSYPHRDTFLGRQLRCQSCRKVFQVDQHGHTSLGEEPSARSGPLAKVQTNREERMQLAKAGLAQLAAEAERSVAGSEAAISGRISRSDIALTESGARHRAVSPNPEHRNQRGKSASIRISSEGEATRRRRQRWLFFCTSLAAVILLFSWLTAPSPQRQILQEFDAAAPLLMGTGSATSIPKRDALSWPGAALAPIIGVDTARLSPVKPLSLSAVNQALAEIQPLGDSSWWVRRSEHDAAQVAWNAALDAAAEWRASAEQRQAAYQAHEAEVSALQANAGANIESLELPPSPVFVEPLGPLAAVRQAAAEQGWLLLDASAVRTRFTTSDEAGRLLATAIVERHPSLSAMIDAGQVTGSLETITFTGDDGKLMTGYGQPVGVAFQGSLVRLVDCSGLDQWLVASLDTMP